MAESNEIDVPTEFDPKKSLDLIIELIGFKRVVEEFGLQKIVEGLSTEQKEELKRLLEKS